MPQAFYDWASDTDSGMKAEGGQLPTPLPVAQWVDTTNTWDPNRALERRRAAELAPRPNPGINPVNGHSVACACAQCPGWYADRARLATQSAQYGGQPVVPEPRKPNPLTDQVIPVCILMAVFTICSMVLVPVVLPVLAVSLALIVVALVAVVVAAVVLLAVFTRARGDIGPKPARAIRGIVLKRR